MSTIVGLSHLTSSIMIFNLFNNLQEDVLSSLNVYTQYGKLALENLEDGAFPFQKLVFLIRDWNVPDDYSYGKDGGQKFLADKLKDKAPHSAESKHVRQSIRNCFQETHCFLMPTIGETAKLKDFTGSVNELSPEFVRNLEEFICSTFGSNNLVTKKMLEKTITATELESCLNLYVEIFNSQEMPSAKSMWEATADLHNNSVLKRSEKIFTDVISIKLNQDDYLTPDELYAAQKHARAEAIHTFKTAKKIGCNEKLQEYQEKLENFIFKEQVRMKQKNDEARQLYLQNILSNGVTQFKHALEQALPLPVLTDEEKLTFYSETEINETLKSSKKCVHQTLKLKLEKQAEVTVSSKWNHWMKGWKKLQRNLFPRINPRESCVSPTPKYVLPTARSITTST